MSTNLNIQIDSQFKFKNVLKYFYILFQKHAPWLGLKPKYPNQTRRQGIILNLNADIYQSYDDKLRDSTILCIMKYFYLAA